MYFWIRLTDTEMDKSVIYILDFEREQLIFSFWIECDNLSDLFTVLEKNVKKNCDEFIKQFHAQHETFKYWNIETLRYLICAVSLTARKKNSIIKLT